MVDEARRIFLDFDLPSWAIEALAAAKVPADCADELNAKLGCLVDDMRVSVTIKGQQVSSAYVVAYGADLPTEGSSRAKLSLVVSEEGHA